MPALPRHTATLAAGLLPLALSAQQPLSLGKPDAEFKEPFTQIGTLRELRDGRVLVVDPRDKVVLLVDFKTGTSSRVGRNGAGPGEYALPARIIALAADTSAIYDPSNARYLLVTPSGSPGEVFRLHESVRASLGGRGSVPRSTDARGRIFFEGSPFTTDPSGEMRSADSTPVMRYDRATGTLDTLAWVQLATGYARAAAMPNGGLMISVGMVAFPARDDWGSMPDGGVAIARVRDYHVDHISPSGARTSGSPVQVNPIPVTESEKEAWRAERRALAGPQATRNGGVPRGPVGPPPQAEFPAVMPPFVYWSTFARPNGELWVLRSRKASDEVPVYDVFNSSGAMVGRVALPAKSRLAGLGNGTVYVVRKDEDDLEYLQRYKVPFDAKLGR
jgi:hypothetical protein